MAVPDKVLAWLYSILQEYRDRQRTYSDSARILATYSSLGPRTEVYSYEDGHPALLLTVSGTLPVAFRGTTYNFPIKLWFPLSYPQDPPRVYITPGRDMLVRPGQHVGVDGRVYHPYLRGWSSMWDRASVAELLELLQHIFAKEPPVVSNRQQQQQQQQTRSPQAVGSLDAPQLPPKQTLSMVDSRRGSTVTDTPPARPPKPGEAYAQTTPPRPPKSGEAYSGSLPPRTSSRSTARDGPPLPPLPHESSRSNSAGASQRPGRYDAPLQPPSRDADPYQQLPYRSDGHFDAPAAPGASRPWLGQTAFAPPVEQRSVVTSPISPINSIGGYRESGPPPPVSLSNGGPHVQPYTAGQEPPPQHQQTLPPRASKPAFQSHSQVQTYPGDQVLRQQHQQAPVPLDLLSDPFGVNIVNASPSTISHAPPPIPPNPEKEHLLDALSHTLVYQAQQRVQQNTSAVAPLQAQQVALRNAHDRLQAELQRLEELDSALSSNEAILRRSITECDQTIEAAKAKPLPHVDDVIVAPTMVSSQLWNLCAEEAACREAMYVVQTAVDRGRVSGTDFVRQMRSLGRERFLKLVLARKCAKGLGLDTGVERRLAIS